MLGMVEFARLRSLPAPEQRLEAAKQFEALLLEYLLRTMREASQTESDADVTSGAQTYLEIAEQQFARALAERGGLGIARLVVQGLPASPGSADKGKEVPR